MAVVTTSISRPLKPAPSLDYDGLYLEGLKHIEQLAGKIWTDYNAHDPGITILEVLCYAITELGYRTDYEIGNIIEPAPGSAVLNDFFTLAQLASNAPLTITDYRKLIIDLDGIRNGWLEKLEGDASPQPPLFLNRPTPPAKPFLINFPSATTTEIKLKGLYNVYLQFEEHPDFGDLNDNSLDATFYLKPIGQVNELPFQVEIEFPIWEEISAEFDNIQSAVATSIHNHSTAFEMRLKNNVLGEVTGRKWVFTAVIEINPSGRMVELPITMRVVSGQESVLNYEEFKARFKDEFWKISPGPNPGDPAIYEILKYNGGNPADEPEAVLMLLRFIEKRAFIAGLLENARFSLAEHRNLCEDVAHVYPMSLQEIGLDVELVVATGADSEKIMAAVYYAMERYLSPTIRFYSLREMLDKGYKPEEIFEGPWLCNGFIDSKEGAFTQVRDKLFTSDLVQEFMKIDGVQAVQSISLSRYKQGLIASQNLTGTGLPVQDLNRTECLCLDRPERFLTRLNYSFSTIKIDAGAGKAETPDKAKALDKLSELKALDQLKGDAGQGDFEIPKGEFSNLESYFSIQHDFPINYAIGIEGFSPEETELRKAQARQLKAYLLFYEQLLANFHSQLANVRLLFSYQDAVERTYFTQALFQVPRVQELLKDAAGLDAANYDAYIQDTTPDSAHIRSRVNALAENQEVAQDRRNRFLDHLMARFNESFSEYAAYIFSRNMPRAEQYSRLISDQARFLRNYAVDSQACQGTQDRSKGHSNDRGAAFNYQLAATTLLPDLADYFGANSLQVEGLKKRMVYLTGLPEVKREYVNPFERFVVDEPLPGQFTYSLPDEAGLYIAFWSFPGTSFTSKEDLRASILTAFTASQNLANFVENAGRHELRVDGIDPDTAIGIVDPDYLATFATPAEAYVTLSAYLWKLYSVENFHIVEHILLRQRAAGDPTLPIRHFKDCAALDIEDPYSFRISVVLPKWAGRFSELDFRRLFKRLMRAEAPAHVYLHFFWIDPEQMLHFEHCWNNWLNGDWIKPDSYLLWEEDEDLEVVGEIAKAPMLQENTYHLLIEREAASGESGTEMVNCLGGLRNLGDAYYVLEPKRIVDQWHHCDLLAYPVDPDTDITGAWLQSGPLPAGVCLDTCTGELRVNNEALLHEITLNDWPLVIATISESGEVTYHNLTLSFIANGPTKITYTNPNLHIDAFGNGDSLVEFADPDGAVIMTTIIGWQRTSAPVGAPALPLLQAPMPPGMKINLLNGQVSVDQAADLRPGTYRISLRLMDAEGGETVLTFNIQINPDIEAIATPLTPPIKNQDTYLLGDILATVSDGDGSIVLFEPRANELPLANLGLGWRITPGPGAKGEVYIADLDDFQNALTPNYQLVAGVYKYTLKMRTKDVFNGQSEVNIPLTIKRDNPPVFTPVPGIMNVDQLLAGSTLGTITDALDGGVVSVTQDPLFASMGIAITVNAAHVAVVTVLNQDDFTTAMKNSVADSNNIATRIVSVDLVDVSGGIGRVDCMIKARLDTEPMVNLTKIGNIDTYFAGQVLARITDVDGGGITTAVEFGVLPADAMGTMGMGLQTMIFPGSPKAQTRIFITNIGLFVQAVSSSKFTLINSSTNLVQRILKIRTTDTLGGVGKVDVRIEVIRDIEAEILPVLNGHRVNTYQLNDVLFQMQDKDPLTTFSGFQFNTPLPAGIGMRLVAGQYEIYVSNPSLLVAGSYPRTVTLQDSLGGTTVINVPISILRRLVPANFSFVSGKQVHILDLDTKIKGLRMLSLAGPNFPVNFGTLGIGDGQRLTFTEGFGFPASVIAMVVTINAQIGTELVECTVGVSRLGKIIVVGTGNSNPALPSVFLGNKVLNSTANAANQKSTELTNAVGKMMNDFMKVQNYPDNPTLKTNPKLVTDFATGKRDSTVVAELKTAIVKTVDEVVRLQGVVAKTSGKAEADARAQLAIYAEIYRQQLHAATTYAGEIRQGDLSMEVQSLFELINVQNKRIL